MFERRSDLRYLTLAVFVVLLGLFNSGMDDTLASQNPQPRVSSLRQPLVELGYHFRQQTREELFYRCFGEMALGRQHDRAFLAKHRGEIGEYSRGMLGPEKITGPTLPYRDYVAEYPPANFPFIVAPSLGGQKADSYSTLFRLMLASLNLAAFLLSIQLANRIWRSAGEVRRYLLLSLIAALLLGPIMVTRLDSIALFFFVAALAATSREHPIVAGAMMALATGAKIVPVFLIPFFFLFWWMGGERGKAIRYTVSSVVCGMLIFFPALFAGPDNFRAMFKFHGERPIQVESTYAVVLRLQERLFGARVEEFHSFGSWNIDGPYSELYASASTFLALGVVALMLLVFGHWLRANPEVDKATREQWLVRACGATVAGLMVFSKVFSPQYLIWMWPWIFLAERPNNKPYQAVCLTAFFLTQLITQPFGSAVVQGEIGGTVMLGVRNLCLFFILVLLARLPRPVPKMVQAPRDWGRKTAILPLTLALVAFAVHLQSRAIEKDFSSLSPFFPDQPSVRLEFTSIPPDAPLPFRGYSGIETDQVGNSFAWSVRNRVEHFLPADGSGDQILQFGLINALNLDGGTIELSVNGTRVDLWSDGEDWPRHYTAWVPAAVLKDTGLNDISLQTPQPISPADRGLGTDTRQLGMQMDWISLSEVEGFAQFLSPPPKSVAESFYGDAWVVRTRLDAQPASTGWTETGEGFREASSQVELPEKGPIWFYRPGDFIADFARLPVGSGWSKAGADSGARPLRYLEGDGRLTLQVPPGRRSVSFTVLKSEYEDRPPKIELSIDGKPAVLKVTERELETRYSTEIEFQGGKTEFVFSGGRAALGVFHIGPERT